MALIDGQAEKELARKAELRKKLHNEEMAAEVKEREESFKITREHEQQVYEKNSKEYGDSFGLNVPCVPVSIVSVAMLRPNGSVRGSPSISVIHVKILENYEKRKV